MAKRADMIAGKAALCSGFVAHRRQTEPRHAFTYGVSYVWLDPDDPQALCGQHPLWSASHPAPARFRSEDYGDGSDRTLADQVRADLAPILGRSPQGDVRMITQVRRWGWLFNPITIFLAWDGDAGCEGPVGVVLEVTNTPWKQRHRYVLQLFAAPGTASLTGRVAKVLHVSPFLDETFDYVVRIWDDGSPERFALDIDVVRPGSDEPVLATALRLNRVPATRAALGRSLRQPFAPTHRVSAAIHVQAARLWRKGVPFVAHPRTRKVRP